jgi:hypothetical protein
MIRAWGRFFFWYALLRFDRWNLTVWVALAQS